jgi:hypothetical protein
VGGWVGSRSSVLCKRQQAPASAGKGQAAVQVGCSEVEHERQQGDSGESMCASSGPDVGVGQMRARASSGLVHHPNGWQEVFVL